MFETRRLIALIAFIYQVWITIDATFGPHRLPERIPIHFGLNGQPNGWGSPASLMLPLFPAIALGVFLLMSFIAHHPELFNYPVQVTDENRQRLQAVTQNLLAWMRMEMVCLFATVQWLIISSARHPLGGSPAWMGAPIVAWIVVIFATVILNVTALYRAAIDHR
jgi:uncharacterized membrane protein